MFVLKQLVSLHLCVIVYVCLSAVGSDWGLGPFLLPDWRTELKSTAEALCVPVSNTGPLIQGVSTRCRCTFPSSPCGLVTDRATPALGLLFTKHYVYSYSKNIANIICDHLKRFMQYDNLYRIWLEYFRMTRATCEMLYIDITVTCLVKANTYFFRCTSRKLFGKCILL